MSVVKATYTSEQHCFVGAFVIKKTQPWLSITNLLLNYKVDGLWIFFVKFKNEFSSLVFADILNRL